MIYFAKSQSAEQGCRFEWNENGLTTGSLVAQCSPRDDQPICWSVYAILIDGPANSRPLRHAFASVTLFMCKVTIVLFLLISSAAFAAGTKPSADSVKELLVISGSNKVIDITKAQLTAFSNGPVQQALQGHPLTPEIKRIVEENAEKSSALLRDGVKWENIEPIFVEVYQTTMTQEEVDGIVAFYKTSAGKAMVEKMPVLMQTSGQKLQAQLGPIVEKLKQLQQETTLKLQAEFAKQN
jgi:hypothetical protein